MKRSLIIISILLAILAMTSYFSSSFLQNTTSQAIKDLKNISSLTDTDIEKARLLFNEFYPDFCDTATKYNLFLGHTEVDLLTVTANEISELFTPDTHQLCKSKINNLIKQLEHISYTGKIRIENIL